MGQTLSSITKATAHPKESPLLQPAIEGNLPLIKKLLGEHIATYDYDLNQNPSQLQQYVNAVNAEGNTALIGASFAGHLSICQFLIEDCGANLEIQNGIGCNALWIASGYGHVQILEYFITVVMDSSRSVEKTEEECLDLLFTANSSGDTPFLAAASKGHVNICKSLLKGVIAKCRTSNGIFQAYRMLCAENKAGDTALAIAVGNGYEGPLLDFLLDSEETYWKQLMEEGTMSSSTSNSDVLPLRPLHAKSSKGLTPLTVACERSHTSIVKELIRRGAEPTPDSNGRSPLAVASFCGLMEIVEFLLNDGDGLKMGRELLNVLDTNGCTPLWLAARTGNGKMVKVLLDAGADPSIKNKDDLSPEEAAVQFKKQSVIDAFEDFRRIEILEEN